MTRIDPGPVIVDGVLRYTSPSQISKANPNEGGCLARWGWEYILKRRPPKTKSQELGDAIHHQIEHYVTTGEDARGPHARALARFTPAPKTPGIYVETPMHRLAEDGTLHSAVTATGVPVVGYIDILNISGTYLDSEGDARSLNGGVEILDWKSTSDLKYAKLGPKLLETSQMVTYGKFGITVAPDRPLRLAHGYTRTTGSPSALKTSVATTPHEIQARWHAVERVVGVLRDAASAADPNELDKNPLACSGYGGCPHLTYCRRSPAQTITDILSRKANDNMSLADLLPASMKAATPPAPAPPPAPALSPDAQRLKAAMDAIDAYKAGRPVIAGDAAPVWASILGQPPAPGYAGSGELAGIQVTSVQFAEMLVDGLRKSRGDVATPPPAAAAAPAYAPALVAPETPVSNPAAAFAPPATPPTAPAAEAPKKRGPGRPKKTEAAAGPAVVSASPDAIDIFVDCIPNAGATPLGPTIAAFAAELAAACEVPDIRCSEHPAHAYGKWKGALAATVRAAVSDGKVPGGTYTIDTRSEFGAVAAEALEECVVARGMR